MKLSAAAVAAAEWWGMRLADTAPIQDRRGYFEAELAELVELRLREWREVWLTCREAPDELLTRALGAAGIPLRRGLLSAHGVLAVAHLRVTPDRLRPLENGSWQRTILIKESDGNHNPR